MIVSRTPSARAFIKSFGVPLFLFFGISLLVTVLYEKLGMTWISFPSLPLSLVGAALTIFLAFRNNSAYDRWWEARNLWGALVNSSRTFARQVLTLIAAQNENEKEEVATFQRKLIHYQIAYVHLLRSHLRHTNPLAEAEELIEPEVLSAIKHIDNAPLAIAQLMGEKLREAYDRNWLTDFRLMALDNNLTDLMNIQGGCERIKNTPLPRQYDFFPRFFVNIHWVLLPLGLISTASWFTPVIATLIGFIFLALDNIGREIEDPFDFTHNDIPMLALSRTIEINLRELLKENEIPPQIKPVGGFLY